MSQQAFRGLFNLTGKTGTRPTVTRRRTPEQPYIWESPYPSSTTDDDIHALRTAGMDDAGERIAWCGAAYILEPLKPNQYRAVERLTPRQARRLAGTCPNCLVAIRERNR